MKVDIFTKVLLTVIALNLSVLTVKNLDLIPVAYANEPTNSLELNPAIQYGLIPLNEDGSINVKIIESSDMDVRIVDIETNDELKINIASVDTYDELDVKITAIKTKDELDINIDEVGGSSLPLGGPISVEID